jgi:hypothetical protein
MNLYSIKIIYITGKTMAKKKLYALEKVERDVAPLKLRLREIREELLEEIRKSSEPV